MNIAFKTTAGTKPCERIGRTSNNNRTNTNNRINNNTNNKTI